jgi:hypothetical protein
MEAATYQGNPVRRPIVRIEQAGGRFALFTRVDPRLAGTSMIIRPRQGWLGLRDYLNGMEEFRRTQIGPKLRWVVGTGRDVGGVGAGMWRGVIPGRLTAFAGG